MYLHENVKVNILLIIIIYSILERTLPGNDIVCPKCNTKCSTVASSSDSHAIFVSLKGITFITYYKSFIGLPNVS